MLLNYIQAAMAHAHYEILPDSGQYYGEIPECNGVWSQAPTLEKCRIELQEVLEEWLFQRIRDNVSIPTIDGLSLTVKEVA